MSSQILYENPQSKLNGNKKLLRWENFATIYSTNVERLFFARFHEGGSTEGSNYAEEIQHSFKAVLSQSGAQGVAHQAQEQKKEVGARDFNYSKRSLFSMADRQN
jgi:hypothetical protein